MVTCMGQFVSTLPQLPMECRINLTPGIWVHWSVAYGPLLQGLPLQLGDMAQVRGDVMAMSSVAG